MNSEPSPKTRERSLFGPFRPFVEIVTVAAVVWGGSLAVVGLADPVTALIVDTANNLSAMLSVSKTAIIVSAGIAVYVSLFFAAMQTKGGIALLKRFPFGLKSERAFYTSGTTDKSERLLRQRLSNLNTRLRAIEQNSTSGLPPSEDDWDKIREKSVNAAISNLTEELTLEVKRKLQSDRIELIWKGSLSRLSDQIIVLGSRANLTLWVGIIFCTAGLIVLWYSFFASDAHPNSLTTPGLEWVELAKGYAPRLTLVILIELIGFFFLKMYRATLFEIRYVQNEITNIEMRFLALNSALSEDHDTLSTIIEALALTDRNSVIEKGQTTVEIEKYRATNEADQTVFAAAVSLLHGTEKASIWRRSSN